jgi:HSP20 family protein
MAYDMKPFNRDYFDMSPSEMFRDFGRQFFSNIPETKNVRTDINEMEDRYELTAELPGFTKDAIDVTYENGLLTIKAENNMMNEAKDDDGRVIQKERSFSNVKRVYSIGNVDEDNIEASFKDGVLSLTLPKLEKNKKKSIEIREG